MVNKVTFLGFRGVIAPPPRDPPMTGCRSSFHCKRIIWI